MNRTADLRAAAACLLAAVLTVALPPHAEAAERSAQDRQAKCIRLESRIAELRLKLRMGYTAKQGRIYRQKLSALSAEHRALCR